MHGHYIDLYDILSVDVLRQTHFEKRLKYLSKVGVNPFFHNVKKWSNILLKSYGVNTA